MYEFLRYRVRDVMTRNPVTVGPDTPVGELEALLAENDFNGVPVVDAEGRLAGMATKLDVLKAFAFTTATQVPRYDEIVRRVVAEVMTHEPVAVSPDLPLTRVLQKMVEMRNKSFPVLDGDSLAGVISREDVLRGLHRAVRGELPEGP